MEIVVKIIYTVGVLVGGLVFINYDQLTLPGEDYLVIRYVLSLLVGQFMAWMFLWPLTIIWR